MRTRRLLKSISIMGLMGFAAVGCSSSGGGDTGSGGTSSPANTGGAASGGVNGSGGSAATGGAVGSGGTTATPPSTGGMTGSGGAQSSGGAMGSGGAGSGGRGGGRDAGGPMGGQTSPGAGGSMAAGGAAGGTPGADGGPMGSGGVGAGGTTGPSGTGGRTTQTTGGGTCTASKDAGKTASGSGPHKVVVESNSDNGINCGTIYRPADLGGDEKYPIFVWGEGGCSRNGSSNLAAMGEIASHGYFVIADGPANGGGNCGSISMSNDVAGMAKPLISYIDWAIAENDKPCSAYYQSLDTKKIAADGFSCGGLMAMGTAGDPRMTTWGITSSGLTSSVPSFYKTVHTPVKVLLGGSGDVAYSNGERDYDNISALDIPIVLFSKALGHGGDLGSKNGGDFTKVNLAWLNWQLKGDTTATGKGFLVGDSCTFCKDSAWEVKSANLP
jgi:hypothetical protein